MSSKILKFSKDRLITGINIVDGMLFFTDNHSEPKKINIEKFKGNDPDVPVDHSTGTTSIYRRTFQEADITVIKGHPKHALNTDLTTSGGYSSGGGDGYGGGGGDIIVDPTPDPVANTFRISTQKPSAGASINKINLEGRLITGVNEIGEQGFYYTFSDSFGSRTDLEDIDSLIENLGNGVYKIQEDALSEGIYNLQVPTSTASSQGAVVGGYVYYIAYCIVKVSNNGTQRDEVRYASKKEVYKLEDTTSVPTGTISDLKVTISKRPGLFAGASLSTTIYATFSNTTNLLLNDLPRGFYISAAYKEIDNPTPPTTTEITAQVDDKPVDSQSLFPIAYNQRSQTSFGFGNENQLNLNTYVDMSALNTGDLYFVYCYIELPDGTIVYSPVERFVVDAEPNQEGPSLAHKPADVQETEVGLNAEVYNAGAEATITERGFVFSTEVDEINTVNRIFTDFNSQAPYEYNGNESINNTFKVPVPIPTGEDGLGDISISTENYLTNLLGGTTLNYVAYAINSRGQRSYGGDYSVGGFFASNNGMLSVITQENSTPRIQAGVGLNYYKHEGANTDPLEPIFTFKVLGGISDPTKVTSMGIVYAYATGPNIDYGVTYENLIKFAGDEEHSKIDLAPTSVNLDITQFDYTGVDADQIIGNFAIKDGFEIAGSKYINPDDSALVEAIRVSRGDDHIESLSYTWGQPLIKTLSYYAYIEYDGVTYKSKVSRGWFQGNSAIWGDLTAFTGRYCGTMAMIAPTFFSGGREASKTHLPEKPPVGGTAQIYGAMCPNSLHGGTVGGSLQELGFYWSETPIDAGDANIATNEKIKKWTEASTTSKVPCTGGGPNAIDPTNPVNTGTSAKHWHVGATSDNRGHFEFSATIGPFSSNATKIYWVPYLKPQPRGDLAGLWNFSAPPVDIYANSAGGGALNSFSIGSAITTIDVEPSVSITSAKELRSGFLGFTGMAEPGSSNYEISRKGFYIKPLSSFATPNDQASVKTEMANATGRTTLYTNNNFNPGSEYGASSTFATGSYLASAFCEIIIAGTTYIRISDNNRREDIGTPPASTVITTPVVTNTGGGDVMSGTVDSKGVAIASKGFYLLEVKGKLHNNPNLSKPSNGAALKQIFNGTLPSNVTAINEPSSSTDPLSSAVFRASIPNQKRGYVYYYAAYVTNSKSEEGISPVVKHKEYQEVIDKFIEISPVPFSHTIKADNRGRVSLSGDTSSYVNQVSVKVTTENNSADNFKFTVSQWNSGGRISTISKRTSPNGNFLDIPLLEANFQTSPRQCTLKITHATDPSKEVALSILQEGNSIIMDEFDDFIPPRDLLNDDLFGNDFGNLF
jgi:hypothetical protein